ncbi:hypothetical protein Taro_056009, partial [Colocasia esculenta]|nr:hypothetical protein [Colocasia esculenta]
LWPPSASYKSFSYLPAHLGFDMAAEAARFLPPTRSNLDLTVPQLLRIAQDHSTPIRLALDVGGSSGTFAARMKLDAGVVVITTTMDLGAPYNKAAALRDLVPLHVPLQQRLPVHDAALDLVRCGHAVNRWIPAPAMEFLLYDADRVLRAGGLLWLDHFFCRPPDLDAVYTPMIGKLGYWTLKWTMGNKTDSSGVRNGEVYLTALLQKPIGNLRGCFSNGLAEALQMELISDNIHLSLILPADIETPGRAAGQSFTIGLSERNPRSVTSPRMKENPKFFIQIVIFFFLAYVIIVSSLKLSDV